MMVDAKKIRADAATASAPMSGIAKELIILSEGAHVHRAFRSRVRGEESGARRLARHAVPRVPVRRPAVAQPGAARRRTGGGAARRDDDDPAEFRELPVLAQPRRGV